MVSFSHIICDDSILIITFSLLKSRLLYARLCLGQNLKRCYLINIYKLKYFLQTLYSYYQQHSSKNVLGWNTCALMVEV